MDWLTMLLFLLILISSIQLYASYRARRPHIERDTNNPPKARQLIISHLKFAKKNAWFFSGGGFAKVYNDENVLKAFREARQRKVKIIVLVEKDELDPAEGENGLEILQKEQIIELHKGCKPITPLNHFRVIDTSLLYTEEQDHLQERSLREDTKPYIIYRNVKSKIFNYIDTFNELYSTCLNR